MTRALWQESFIPVVLVVLAIALSLLFVQYEVAQESDRAIVIVIADNAANDDTPDSDEGGDIGEEETVAATSDDPERTRILKLIDEQKWQEADQALKARLAENPSSETLTDLGMLNYQQRNFEKAMEYLNRAIDTKPIDASAYFYRALVYSKQGEVKKAIADYQRQVELVPYHFEANYNLGLMQLKSKDYSAAGKTFEHAATLAGGRRKARTFYNLGLALSHQGSDFREKAEKAFNSAIRLQPDYIAPRFGLASLESDDKPGQERALKQYETVLKLRPNYAPAYFRMGLSYSALGNTKASIAAYRKAIRYNPAYLKAHYNLGLQLINARKWNDATRQFEWILARKPKHSRSHFNLGRVANGKKDYALAIEQYRKALELRQGNYPEALVNMGLIHAEQGEYDRAISTYNRAIQLRPDYANAWHSMGMAQQQVGKMAEAERSLKTAIQHKPTHTQAWADLGALYVAEGRLEEAIRAYHQALQLHPDDRSAEMALASIYEQQKHFDDAIALYGAVLSRYASYVPTWQKLGAAHLAAGNYGEAEEALRQALQLDPQNVEVKRLLARVMLKRHSYAEAVGLLAEVVEANVSRADLRLEYAEALKAAGDAKAARAELTKGLRLAPDNQELMQAMKLMDGK